MDDTIAAALAQIRERRRALEAEAQRLLSAEQALVSILGPESSVSGAVTSGKTGNLTLAVKEAVRTLGSATSGDIIIYLQKTFNPTVNRNSVRSILSVARTAGHYTKHGDHFALAGGSPEGA